MCCAIVYVRHNVSRFIANLELSSEVEQSLQIAFVGWADFFFKRLSTYGFPPLASKYESIIRSIETQSCRHGQGGTLQTGDAWQYCCGIWYEYDSDTRTRTAIEIILTTVPAEILVSERLLVADLDERLYALYDDPPLREGYWWEKTLPRGVIGRSNVT
jgi:hypothetical protein